MSDIAFAAKLERRTTAVCIADINKADTPLVYANQAFSKLTGYPASYCVGRNCRFLQCAETDPIAVTRMRVAVQRKHSIEVCILNKRENGEPFHNFLFMTPFKHTDGKSYFLGCQYEINPHSLRLEHHFKELNETIGSVGASAAFGNIADVLRMRANAIQALVETYIRIEMGTTK